MLTRPKPGTIVWCAESGVIKQLEVVPESFAKSRSRMQHDEVCVRYPNDNIVLPWYCWLGYLFEKKEDAVKLAIEQLTQRMDNNNWLIQDTRSENRELKRQIQQYEETINGLAKT